MKKNISSAHRQQALRGCLCGSCAFSLVEVVLSLGITSFALLAIVALLPIGLQSTKDSLEETGAVNVLNAVIADRQVTPFSLTSRAYQLPVLDTATPANTAGSFEVSANNQYVVNRAVTVPVYQVDYLITTPPLASPLDPYLIHFRVSWPPKSKNPSGALEVVATFSQP